jgi:hypothetical protein
VIVNPKYVGANRTRRIYGSELAIPASQKAMPYVWILVGKTVHSHDVALIVNARRAGEYSAGEINGNEFTLLASQKAVVPTIGTDVSADDRPTRIDIDGKAVGTIAARRFDGNEGEIFLLSVTAKTERQTQREQIDFPVSWHTYLLVEVVPAMLGGFPRAAERPFILGSPMLAGSARVSENSKEVNG